jgi:Na+-driven multidrug efflux pump
MIQEMLKVGIPTFMFQLLTSVAIGLTNYKASMYGDDAIAAIGIVFRLMTIGLYVVFGYTKGFQPFVGYNYGARNIKRVEQAIQFSLRLTTIFCGTISIVFIIFNEQIIKLFIDNQEIVTIGSRCLIANSIFFATFGYQMVYATLFLALGKGKEGGIISLLRQGICLIPLVLILPSFFGLNGLLYAQGIADVITTLITSIFVVRFYRELGNESVTLSKQS